MSDTISGRAEARGFAAGGVDRDQAEVIAKRDPEQSETAVLGPFVVVERAPWTDLRASLGGGRGLNVVLSACSARRSAASGGPH